MQDTVIILHSNNQGFGGIETLLLRFYDYLTAKGFKVWCFLKYDTYTSRNHYRPNMSFLGDDLGRMLSKSYLQKQLTDRNITNVRIAIAMDTFSALLAPLLSKTKGNDKCVAVATNWVPCYFFMQACRRLHPLTFAMTYNLMRNYCKDNTLFLAPSQITEGRKVLGAQWDATLFPVPISFDKYNSVRRKPERNTIVSVGRLDGMKEYNLYMVDIVDRLVQRGHDIHWHVYGDGGYKQQIISAIIKKQLNQRIHLYGELPYSQLPKIFETAGYFVGMGTSMLEAAASGVPTVVAIGYDTTGITHGPIYKQEYGNLGDISESQKLLRVEDELERLLQLSQEDYEKECLMNVRAANEYSESKLMPMLEQRLALSPIYPGRIFCWFLELYVFIWRPLKSVQQFISSFKNT